MLKEIEGAWACGHARCTLREQKAMKNEGEDEPAINRIFSLYYEGNDPPFSNAAEFAKLDCERADCRHYPVIMKARLCENGLQHSSCGTKGGSVN